MLCNCLKLNQEEISFDSSRTSLAMKSLHSQRIFLFSLEKRFFSLKKESRPYLYYNSIANQRKLFDEIFQKCNLTKMDDWYKVKVVLLVYFTQRWKTLLKMVVHLYYLYISGP